MAFGWIIVSFMTFFVGLSMAEIVSAIPTSGGPYFWAATLAPQKYSAFFSWLTGWFNFVGQVFLKPTAFEWSDFLIWLIF